MDIYKRTIGRHGEPLNKPRTPKQLGLLVLAWALFLGPIAYAAYTHDWWVIPAILLMIPATIIFVGAYGGTD